MSFDIWNNLDEIALYLGLTRLDSETNEEFFERIRLFGRWKYKTDYLTQVHSVPLQTGLKTKPIVRIKSESSYECTIDWEYFYLKNDAESIRVFINSDDTIGKVLDVIDSSSTFSYSVYGDNTRDINLKYLIRDSNVRHQQDYADTTNFNFSKRNIKKGSLFSNDNHVLITEKDSILDLKNNGDYFIDYKTGYMQVLSQSFTGTLISYKYFDDTFRLESTELNMCPVNLKFKYGITDESIKLIPSLLDKQVWG